MTDMRKTMDMITLGSGFVQQNDGILGSRDVGLEMSPNCSPEDAKIVLELLARHLDPGAWHALQRTYPDVPDALRARGSGQDSGD